MQGEDAGVPVLVSGEQAPSAGFSGGPDSGEAVFQFVTPDILVIAPRPEGILLHKLVDYEPKTPLELRERKSPSTGGPTGPAGEFFRFIGTIAAFRPAPGL